MRSGYKSKRSRVFPVTFTDQIFFRLRGYFCFSLASMQSVA